MDLPSRAGEAMQPSSSWLVAATASFGPGLTTKVFPFSSAR